MATEEYHSDEKVNDYVEKGDSAEFASSSPGNLKRQLKNRHVAMISIGGVIGTGLFLVRATRLRRQEQQF